MPDPRALSSESDLHLSQVSTHSDLSVQDLCLRYRQPVERFLRRILGDPEATADLTQDIMVKLLLGKLAAWEGRGRFRDYLKAVVRHEAIDYRARGGKLLLVDLDSAAERNEVLDASWDMDWARHVQALTWHSLRRYQGQCRIADGGRRAPRNVFYTLLRLRVKHPRDRTAALTRRLAEATRRPYTEANVRQQLARARAKFVELLKEEILRGLPPNRAADLDRELLDQNLSRYVRKFLRDEGAAATDPSAGG